MKTVEFEASVSILCIAIAFSFLASGFVNRVDALIVIGIIGGIASIGLSSHTYQRLKIKEEKQEKREKERHEALIGELKGIREDLKNKG